MSRETIYQRNIDKIRELMPEKQWSGEMWLSECDRLGFRFKIIEAFRTQERQNALYAQGRTKSGPVVTWTKDSDHTRRLAVDVVLLNCKHSDLESIAKKYGIEHPWPVMDPPHYSFVNAKGKPTPSIPKSIEAALRRLKRQVESAKEPRKSRLESRKAHLETVNGKT